MDNQLKTVVEAVRAVERQLRETALTPALARRGEVPRTGENQLLGAVAGLTETLREFTGAFEDRMFTPSARKALFEATRELGGPAVRLRAAERRAGEGGV